MKVIEIINKKVYQGERIVAICTFISMILIMFVQVFFRYVIKESLAWTEEVMRYLFVVTSFFGASCATYEKKHIVIDFLGTILNKVVRSEKKKEVIFSSMDVVVDLICGLFFVYMSMVMGQYAADLYEKNSLSTALQFPLSYICGAVVAALALCAIHYFVNLVVSVTVLIKDAGADKGGDN